MKKLEVTISETGVKITRENDHDLPIEYKFILWISFLAVAGFLAFFWMMIHS